MAEVRNENIYGGPDANAKKRKSFWSKLFRQSNNKTGENKHEEPKKNFMGSVADSARQVVTREVMHVAEHEAMKEVDHYMHNNNNTNTNNGSGSQPISADTSGVDPSTAATPSDALSAPTSWAKRMVDNAQQKMQSLQGLAS